MFAVFLQQKVLTLRIIFSILSFAPFHMGGGKGANVCGRVATLGPRTWQVRLSIWLHST